MSTYVPCWQWIGTIRKVGVSFPLNKPMIGYHRILMSGPAFRTRGYTVLTLGVLMAAPGRCFLVTGPPGVGKTTLVMRVLESLKASHPDLHLRGFYTREVRDGSQRVGFEVVTVDGRCGCLASSSVSSFESQRWPSVGKYRVDVSSFQSLALPELQVDNSNTGLFIIDEVGKMEMYCPAFFPAVLRILESGIPLLASIPIPKAGRDIPGVARLRNHPGATVYTLTLGNRETVKELVYSHLANALHRQ